MNDEKGVSQIKIISVPEFIGEETKKRLEELKNELKNTLILTD